MTRPTLVFLAGPIAVLAALSCGAPHPEWTAEVEALWVQRIPENPADGAWSSVPFHRAAMLPQDMVEPRLLDPWAPGLRVQAMTDGREVAFRLEWDDDSRDDLPGASRFSDACAVQLPHEVRPDVPAPQMGEPRRTVEIAFWKASWQASVEGRDDAIRSLYPGATVDHYPFEAPSLEAGSDTQQRLAALYAPARALGNVMEGPRGSSVEDLLAEGPGTLTTADRQRSRGTGTRTGTGWAVLIVRPLPEGLGPGDRSQIAFAVWDGRREDVGARKMRSGWVGLLIRGEAR